MSGNVTSIWDLLTKFVLFLLFVAAGVAIFFWYLPLIQQSQRMRRDIIVLENEVKNQERLAKSYRNATESILNDPRTLERLAREKLSYARSNETIFVFKNQAPAGAGHGESSGSVPAQARPLPLQGQGTAR